MHDDIILEHFNYLSFTLIKIVLYAAIWYNNAVIKLKA